MSISNTSANHAPGDAQRYRRGWERAFGWDEYARKFQKSIDAKRANNVGECAQPPADCNE